VTHWNSERFQEGLRVRSFFDGLGYSHRVLYDHSIMKMKENAEATLMVRSSILNEFTRLLKCEYLGAELPSAFHFHTQFVAFNPWAIDKAATWTDPLERGAALFHHIAQDIKTSDSLGMCRDLARYFAMHSRVMDNYPSALPVGMNGGDTWEKCFLTSAKLLDQEVSTLVEAKNAVAKLVKEMYPVFVRQREADFEELGRRLESYMRLYWRGSAPRQFHQLILNYPRFYGVSPKVVDEINALGSFAMDPFIPLSLAQVFGKHWRYYVCRYAKTDEAKKTILHAVWTEDDIKKKKHLAWGADGPTGLNELPQAVATAIHDAGYWLPGTGLDRASAKELGAYLMRHDYARNRPHVQTVGRSWSHLSEEEKSMPPAEAAANIVRRVAEKLETMMSQVPEEVREEVSKWLAASAGDCDETLAEWVNKNLALVAETYERAVSTPMPAWAQGQVELGECVAKWLPRDDPRTLFVGHYTDCCQYVGGLASKCAVHSCTSPRAALLVVEKRGQIVAQSWVWEGRDGRVCFDNIEVQRSERNEEFFERLLMEVARGIPRRVTAGTAHTHAPFKTLPRMPGGKEYLPEDYDQEWYSDADTYVVLKAA
jgi:hypothetical protein